jgi:arylsulfatase A-like enzyme
MGHPVHAVDWMPTFTALAGATPARDPKWDGTDIWPLIDGSREALAERDLFWNFRGSEFGLCRGPWKLIARGEDPSPADCELYHLDTDPGETRDRTGDRPAIVRDLLAAVAEQRRFDGTDQRPDADDPLVR